jgi:Uncharacterized conserved protein
MKKEIIITVENFGPFEKAEIKLKPLTIFIGKNSVGKSILMRLVWTLLAERIPLAVLISALFLPLFRLPSFILSTTSEEAAYISTLEKVKSNILSSIEKGLKPSEEDIRTVLRFYIKPLLETN